MLGVSGPFHSMLNKGIGLYDPQESFQLCCSKVLSMEKHMGLWEDLLGTLNGYTI